MPPVLYKQIADDLRQRIESGDLVPGDDVPTESELADRWSTSRGPIRNALAELRNEGLIETTRGRPGRVATRKASQAVDVSIPFTRWAREIGAVPGALTQQISLRRATEEQALDLGVAIGATVVDVLRLRTLDGRPTLLERLTFIEDVGRLLLDVDLDSISIAEYLNGHGYGYGNIEHEIDAVAADEVDASLLEISPGSPVLRLRRFARDDTGRVYEASDDRYRSDIVRFTVAASGRPRSGDHYTRALAR